MYGISDAYDVYYNRGRMLDCCDTERETDR